jgi:hypothetical protein
LITGTGPASRDRQRPESAPVAGTGGSVHNGWRFGSQEYFQKHDNNAGDWLFADYRATLGRNPDTTDYQYWLGQLQ